MIAPIVPVRSVVVAVAVAVVVTFGAVVHAADTVAVGDRKVVLLHIRPVSDGLTSEDFVAKLTTALATV